jgi:hypothetical protein
VLTADYIWQLGIMSRAPVSAASGVALVILTYASGQVIAHFSALFLEYGAVDKLLKRPTGVLLGDRPKVSALRYVFRNYYRALPLATGDRVRAQASARGCHTAGESLFLHVYSTVTVNEKLQARLDDFRNQYGFARNMAFAFIVAAGSIWVAHWRGDTVQVRWAFVAATAAIVFFYRYLKFFRQYSYELLIRYAELPQPEAKAAHTGAGT